MALEVRSLSKNYGKVQALKNVSFKIGTGVYGLLGPNGAGKSTMIRIITGSMRASSGEVLYNGSRIRENEKAYKKILGYVPQRQGMYDSFTAARFLEYMAVLKELKRKKIPEEVERVLKIVGLQEDALRRLGGFSGGMKQRVLIAQALLGDPRIIILDEPTAGLDPKERIKIRNFISRIGENRTILLATHVVSDVESIAREILLLGDGELKDKGTPRELCAMLDGSVFECILPGQEGFDRVEAQFPVSNVLELPDGRISVRVIGSGREVRKNLGQYGVREVFPNLQEVYLSLFDKRQVTV
ncbi:MAG: ATP-binding cassette domain-containing protein [Mediterraneibacter sp.]